MHCLKKTVTIPNEGEALGRASQSPERNTQRTLSSPPTSWPRPSSTRHRAAQPPVHIACKIFFDIQRAGNPHYGDWTGTGAGTDTPRQVETVCLWLGANVMMEFTFDEV